ncbi:MAG TPA: rhomboid family intramembrane serine protease [Conexivisphaerales archaeon]|nr:rhomboid family intramembrane serine protease [Conexivisphaerales archaeon]
MSRFTGFKPWAGLKAFAFAAGDSGNEKELRPEVFSTAKSRSWKSRMYYPYRVRWTYVLIGMCVFIFLLQNIAPDWPGWVYLAFFPAYAFQYPWMFVTSIFLHASIDHILFNMIALFFFGSYLERIVGPRLFLLVFFAAGIVGNFGYMLTAAGSTIPAIGASGAIYGIVGMLAVLTPMTPVYVYFIVPMPMVVFAALYAVLDFIGLFVPSYMADVAHGAHIAGLVVGVVMGLYVRKRYRLVIR